MEPQGVLPTKTEASPEPSSDRVYMWEPKPGRFPAPPTRMPGAQG